MAGFHRNIIIFLPLTRSQDLSYLCKALLKFDQVFDIQRAVSCICLEKNFSCVY